jgi:diguanylate cyclase (GGDEF)-like protein/PAS domain S-box-containing protein
MDLENRTQKIREGEQSFSRILEYSPVGIVLMDKDLCVTFINRQTQDCFGYSLDDLKGVGLLAQIVERIEKSENIILIDKLKSLLPPPAEPGSYGPIDIKIPAKDESSHHTEVTFTAIEEGYLVSIVDVTKRKLAEEKLYSQSVTDAMTGLYNRRHYQECIENEFLRSKRYDHPLTLIIFDVDLFKLINDQYGHPAGDSVLCSLAELTRSCFRSTDLIFRIGGEEFAVLLPETEEDLGWMAAERFRCAVEENRTVYEDKLISHTISLGIGTTNNNIENVGDFIKQTDIALYRAKHRGRNCSETAVYQ